MDTNDADAFIYMHINIADQKYAKYGTFDNDINKFNNLV